jgi:diguanylate cyclase (GGDEF)-like protein
MLDVDQLKRINDSLSHAAGDEALIAVGDNLLLGARPMDTVCRLGGDEFLIIMSGADEETALARAEELRKRIDGLTVSMGDREMPISVSIGVAAAPVHGRGAAEIMAAADEALHAAKAAGRDRVEVVGA